MASRIGQRISSSSFIKDFPLGSEEAIAEKLRVLYKEVIGLRCETEQIVDVVIIS